MTQGGPGKNRPQVFRFKEAKTPIAQRVINLRQTLNVSRRELAKMFRLTEGAVFHWENETAVPSGTALIILEMLEKRVEEMLEEQVEK